MARDVPYGLTSELPGFSAKTDGVRHLGATPPIVLLEQHLTWGMDHPKGLRSTLRSKLSIAFVNWQLVRLAPQPDPDPRPGCGDRLRPFRLRA